MPTLKVSVSKNFKCDSCKRMVSVVRSGEGIEGEVCDDCAGVNPSRQKPG